MTAEELEIEKLSDEAETLLARQFKLRERHNISLYEVEAKPIESRLAWIKDRLRTLRGQE